MDILLRCLTPSVIFPLFWALVDAICYLLLFNSAVFHGFFLSLLQPPPMLSLTFSLSFSLASHFPRHSLASPSPVFSDSNRIHISCMCHLVCCNCLSHFPAIRILCVDRYVVCASLVSMLFIPLVMQPRLYIGCSCSYICVTWLSKMLRESAFYIVHLRFNALVQSLNLEAIQSYSDICNNNKTNEKLEWTMKRNWSVVPYVLSDNIVVCIKNWNVHSKRISINNTKNVSIKLYVYVVDSSNLSPRNVSFFASR